jgi:ribosome maturation factor RimP
MEKDKMTDLIHQWSLPEVEAMGYDLVDVEFVKEGANWYLRLYIDREPNVDLDDCERVSRMISAMLDRKDLIPMPYFLEVSSPGIERVLKREKDLSRFKGSLVNVHLFAPVEGKKRYQGLLGAADDQTLTLNINDQTIRLPRDQIAVIRLAWEG